MLVLLALPAAAETGVTTYAPVVKKAAPAVVNIFAKRVVQQRTLSPLMADPMFRQFFGGNPVFSGPVRERVEHSLGSGVIISADGLIVTSNHVVKDAEAISVVLADKREFAAKVTKRDPQMDLAFLHIEAKEPLPYLELRDSDTLEVGDVVLAIGNPFGIGQTVTHGIISALARPEAVASDYQFFIQTDAPINPGNSGGALVDTEGRLIGINTAIYSTSGGSNGIGFAIPSNMVKALEHSQVRQGVVMRPWWGLTAQPVTREVANAMGLKSLGGALVDKVRPGSPAAKAGIVPGDVITMIGNSAISDNRALFYRIDTAGIGSNVEVTLIHKGEEKKVMVMPAVPPESHDDARTIKPGNPLSGLSVATLTDALADELGIEALSGQSGVVVLGGVSEGGMVLQKGDLITAVNGHTISTVAQLEDALNGDKHKWTITVHRGAATLTLSVQM